MLEKELKRAVSDYLQYKTNLGELYADQLFTGEAIEVRGKTRRKIQGCRTGTADFYVIRGGVRGEVLVGDNEKYLFGNPRFIFLELKGDKGKTSPAQKAFKTLVEEQGAEYFVIRSMEDLEKALI